MRPSRAGSERGSGMASGEEVGMSEGNPDIDTVRRVLARACRAPSLHNSQPWRWRWDGSVAALFVDAGRLLPSTDAFNCQGILACGAVLDHAQTACAAAGWEVRVIEFPEPADRAHLASLTFTGWHRALEADELLAAAIDARYTDRMPMTPPESWAGLEVVLRSLCRRRHVDLRVLDAGQLRELDDISQTTAALRRHDPRYQRELTWWAGNTARKEVGIPASALPSSRTSAHVPAGRVFPAGSAAPADEPDADDRATLIALSTRDDSAPSLLACGTALSAVLLECTVEGLSTCVLTHMTEVPSVRARVADLLNMTHPQALIRIGESTAPRPPPTPRRPIDEVLEVVLER